MESCFAAFRIGFGAEFFNKIGDELPETHYTVNGRISSKFLFS
jgi:hypothetical protein